MRVFLRKLALLLALLYGLCVAFILLGSPKDSARQEVHKFATATTQSVIHNASAHKSGNTSQSDRCKSLSQPTHLQPGILPITALASFPGSGNTWARILISSLTGIKTGDVYKDPQFRDEPGFSMNNDDTVIVIKTHHPFWDESNGPDRKAPRGRYYERAVVLVRHPLDASISGFSYAKTRSHIRPATLGNFLFPNGTLTAEWDKWAHDQIKNWARFIRYWVADFQKPVLLVFYENLKQNLEKELIAISSFLKHGLEETRLKCTLFVSGNKFKREYHIDRRLVFNSAMLSEVEEVLENTTLLLDKFYRNRDPLFSLPESYSPNMTRSLYANKLEEGPEKT